MKKLRLFRNSSHNSSSKELSSAQLYNHTFNFAQVFIQVKFIKSNNEFDMIDNFTDEKQNNSEIHYEKNDY